MSMQAYFRRKYVYATNRYGYFNFKKIYFQRTKVILTDSQAAINALRSNKVNARLVYALIYEMCLTHVWLDGNEAADELTPLFIYIICRC